MQIRENNLNFKGCVLDMLKLGPFSGEFGKTLKPVIRGGGEKP